MIRAADLYDRTTRLILAEGQGTVIALDKPLSERDAMKLIVARNMDEVPLRHLDREGLPKMVMLIDRDGWVRGKLENAIATALCEANACDVQQGGGVWGDAIVQPAEGST